MKNKRLIGKDTLEETIRSLDLGDGITVSMGLGENISYFYTNQMETPFGLPRGIQVEVSSSYHDDKELLHYLLNKTRQNNSEIE